MSLAIKLSLIAAVILVVLPSSLSQITFSRSWVPQGKRSGDIMSMRNIDREATLPKDEDACKEAKLELLSQFAEVVAEFIQNTYQSEGNYPAKLRNALFARNHRPV